MRVWGQDASSINRVTLDAYDGLMLHEAWAEVMLLDTSATLENLSLKIGRQELVYDDSRLLGNLDWLQQGRRHDLALLKLEHKGWLAHLGAGFNQNQERKTASLYNGIPTGYAAGTNGIGSLYKSMQFLYGGRKFKAGNASILFLKDDFNRYQLETGSRVLSPGTWSRLAPAVPSPLTTSHMPPRTMSRCSGGMPSIGADSKPRPSSRGWTSRPDAIRADITASWSGLTIR